MNSACCESSRIGKVLAMVFFLTTATPSEAEDDAYALGGSLGAASDYTFRGVSQTMGMHAIHASVDISLSSGLYAYAWGSNIDFIPDNEPDDGATHEIDMAVGFATELGDDWSLDLTLIRYLFPGTHADVNYNYNELMAALWYHDKYSATVALSGNVDGTGADSLFYQLGASFDLSDDVNLEVNYGYYDLRDAYGSAYAYIEAGLTRTLGNTAVALAYNDTQGSADLIYDNRVTGPRLVLSLEVEW